MGTVDQTMPALFTASGSGVLEIIPIAQLGAGPDGTAVLAKKGEQLLELLQLSFDRSSPCNCRLPNKQWPAIKCHSKFRFPIRDPAR